MKILCEKGTLRELPGCARAYACAARIVEGNDGSTVLQGKLLHLYNLCGIRLAERTAMRRDTFYFL